ncbi:hypothetical protein PAK_P100170c [Pseudomonas phage PAK_P1]|uniref:Uncharacterized protein n=2 Tax=Pakpunavirus TaxID=1921407 RepID=D4N427_9CAUD|nr:hypothetical protein PAK_P100170c [Pseudomonas phage PAK_P1]YP_010763386.1 hypothetical protein QE330_gp164 [Pseudomonas phage vB_Pae_Kat]YP_010764025.1 hypothetical protein QE333_gp133 [Pseudomonas phage vB_PaeM_B31]WNV48801.1 hypothetical protein [Pseudomonas phage Kat]ADD64997.1 hypothetical protein PAK_P100170c [Pseudomonas phage PAK_P1]UQS93442.1 hypothetical protein Kat_gp034 [Pseudomonas phage vB_Pae_Kat]WBW49165.1 hypothetical protein PB31_133 [Pseudomonas phage vB_PaeM_B31]
MATRTVHYDEWDGGTEADSEEPYDVFCGTDGDFEEKNFSRYRNHITCKRCLKLLDKKKEDY